MLVDREVLDHHQTPSIIRQRDSIVLTKLDIAKGVVGKIDQFLTAAVFDPEVEIPAVFLFAASRSLCPHGCQEGLKLFSAVRTLNANVSVRGGVHENLLFTKGTHDWFAGEALDVFLLLFVCGLAAR